MTWADVLTLVLVSVLVAVEVSNEAADISTTRTYVDEYSPAALVAPGDGRRAGHILRWDMLLPLRVLRTLRYYLVVPQAIALVPRLSLWLGVDALSLIMNALAAVFLLELDNIMFGYLMPPAKRHELVEHAQFKVTKADLRFEIIFRWVKIPCIIFVTLAIISSIYIAASPHGEVDGDFDKMLIKFRDPTGDCDWKLQYLLGQLGAARDVFWPPICAIIAVTAANAVSGVRDVVATRFTAEKKCALVAKMALHLGLCACFGVAALVATVYVADRDHARYATNYLARWQGQLEDYGLGTGCKLRGGNVVQSITNLMALGLGWWYLA